MRKALVAAMAVLLTLSGPVQASAHQGFDAEAFKNPSKSSMPAVYWYWNNTITTAITDKQMAEMRAKGIHEAVLFPYGGDAMQPAFFTEAWFSLVEHVLREAKRTGMKIWLFNDNNFPSGRAAGFVVNGGTIGDRTIKARPELRLKALLRSTRVIDGPATLTLARTSGLSVDAGKLVVDPATKPGAAPLLPGAGWTDYTVTGKVTLTTGGTQLWVRADVTGTSGYLVDVDSKGVASVYRVDDGVKTRLTTGIPTPGFSATRAQTVTVKVTGDTIAPTINNTVQPVATDATYPSGAAAVSAEGTQRSQWDTLTVSNGATLWTNDFTDATGLTGFAQDRVTLPGITAAAARPIGSSAITEITGTTWKVPAGRWQVDVFASALLRDDSSGYVRNYLDLLDPEAVDAWLDVVPTEYARRWPWAMGTVVPGFWDDESFIASAQPHPFKRLAWSPGLAGAVKAAGGKPGTAYLAASNGIDPAAGTYWRAVNNLFATSYYKRQAEWMGRHGLKLISNPLLDEEGPQDRMISTGDLSKDNQWAQVPGSDMITTDYTAGKQTTLARNSASAAHQSGAERVVMETFGNGGWQIAPDYMHATVGALAARGVNQTFLHAMWTDETNVNFPPPFGPRSTFWAEMPTVDTWIGRVMELGRGTDLAETALIQPQRAAEQSRATENTLDEDFAETAFALERQQIDFDLVTDNALAGDPATRFHATSSRGVLRVGKADYKQVVLPPTPILDLAAARRLAEFVRGGGRLVVTGELPQHEATGKDSALRSVLRGIKTSTLGERAVTLQPAAEAVRVKRTGRGDDIAFLLNNESDQVVTTTATFPARGVPEIWDPRTGSTAAATTYDGSAVPITLQPYETLGVVFRAGVKETAHLTGGSATRVEEVRNVLRATIVAGAPGTYRLEGTSRNRDYRGSVTVTDQLTPIPVAGPWTVRLEKDGAVAEERPLGSWTTFDPTFSGSGVYNTTVDLTRDDLAQRRLVLDLGEVHDLATVTVNGSALPVALWHPYTVDVTGALRPGSNTISVRVTNTLANSRNKILPSGLVGPVTLRPQAVATAQLEAVR
ncbi:glycosylhydrolase-like jelly roll fold domain-containing protein [Symbioplanes lichenis]|uniref:glycosylhydrolase-like jelly roll fold domain-containing protein n=1 Tax=Symbioplanes lichenis TaxID=1629072 RepID=UPI002739FAC1|nr:glycosylhydrolase-like jelly roll fold domain-containing protein [Actinoplanes lichenis]